MEEHSEFEEELETQRERYRQEATTLQEKARGLMQKLRDQARITPNTFSYNAAVGACAKCGPWPSALDHLILMPRARILLNIISFSAAIRAGEKGGHGCQP